MARDFIELGEELKIKVECAITYGGQPVGRAVGPALEAQEALQAVDPDQLSPREALDTLYQLKQLAKSERQG